MVSFLRENIQNLVLLIELSQFSIWVNNKNLNVKKSQIPDDLCWLILQNIEKCILYIKNSSFSSFDDNSKDNRKNSNNLECLGITHLTGRKHQPLKIKRHLLLLSTVETFKQKFLCRIYHFIFLSVKLGYFLSILLEL